MQSRQHPQHEPRSVSEQPEQAAYSDEGDPPDIFPTVYGTVDDAADVTDLAQAEQAVARNAGTAEQRDGVMRAGSVRRAEDRIERWRDRRR